MNALMTARRAVVRERCVECGHMKSEHIPNSLCGDFVIETVLLPVCVKCHDRVCEEDEDEICQHCMAESLWAANMTRQLRIAAGWSVDKTGGVRHL